MNTTTATICFLVRNAEGGTQVALPMKLKKIGAGFRNGYGGKIDDGETSEQCAIREMEEEAKIRVQPDGLDRRAHIDFYRGPVPLFACDIFLVRSWADEPQATDEMGPAEWFDISKIPLHEMMAGDQKWVEYLFSGGPFSATLVYSEDMKSVSSFKMIFTGI